MATRSNIAIILKEEDRERVFAELNKRLEEAGDRFRYGMDSGNVLQIYCHWDGYISGVGQDLLNDFNSYDKALKLILEGDHSTPHEPYAGHGERWVSNRPAQKTEPRRYQNYLYVFKDGAWKIPVHEDSIVGIAFNDRDGYCKLEDYLKFKMPRH